MTLSVDSNHPWLGRSVQILSLSSPRGPGHAKKSQVSSLYLENFEVVRGFVSRPRALGIGSGLPLSSDSIWFVCSKLPAALLLSYSAVATRLSWVPRVDLLGPVVLQGHCFPTNYGGPQQTALTGDSIFLPECTAWALKSSDPFALD